MLLGFSQARISLTLVRLQSATGHTKHIFSFFCRDLLNLQTLKTSFFFFKTVICDRQHWTNKTKFLQIKVKPSARQISTTSSSAETCLFGFSIHFNLIYSSCKFYYFSPYQLNLFLDFYYFVKYTSCGEIVLAMSFSFVFYFKKTRKRKRNAR